MDNNDRVNNLDKARGSVNRMVEDLITIANSRELRNKDILQMLLRRMSWEADKAASQLFSVRDDLAWNGSASQVDGLKNEITYLTKRNEDLKARLNKYEPMDQLTPEEHALAKAGNKIPAIKEVRARTGLGLKEAKDLVEKFYPPGTIPQPTRIPF